MKMEIGVKTINTINESICFLVSNYQKQINEAWQMCGDEALTLSISSKLKLREDGKLKIITDFSFTKEKIKDRTVRKVDEDQQDLFVGGESV